MEKERVGWELLLLPFLENTICSTTMERQDMELSQEQGIEMHGICYRL